MTPPTVMTSDVHVVAWIRLLPAGTRAWPTGTSFKDCPDDKGSLQIHEVRKTPRQGIYQLHTKSHNVGHYLSDFLFFSAYQPIAAVVVMATQWW